jgi:hypothetical protein
MELNEFEIKMRSRRVFKQNAAYVVTLPIDWIRNLNINPGDELVPIICRDGLLLKLAEEPLGDG